NTNLDANTAGAALTLTGAGKVAIAAKTVGFADQTRSGSTTSGDSSAIAFDGVTTTTGVLTLYIQNAETIFKTENVYSPVYIGVENGATSVVTVNAPVVNGEPPSLRGLVTVNKGSTLKTNHANSLPIMLRGSVVNNGVLAVYSLTSISAPTSGSNQGKTIVETLSGADSGSSRVNIYNGTILTLNNSDGDSTTYSGVITGNNAWLVKSGAGTQILSGRNTYNETISYTNVTGGTLKITGVLGSTGATTADYSGRIQVGDGATLHFDQTVNQTYSGTTQTNAIQGTIIKSGTGTFTLTGKIEGLEESGVATGTLNVTGGSFVLDNSGGDEKGIVSLAQTNFSGGSTLAGNGGITGNVTFAANTIISPGKPNASDATRFGEIHFTSTNNSVVYDNIQYKINVAHDNDSNTTSDFLSHTGSVVFKDNNTININGIWGGTKRLQYTILTTTGGVTTNGTSGTTYEATTFLEDGSVPDPHHFYSLTIGNGGNDLILNAVDAYYALYWGATKTAATHIWADKAVNTTRNFYRADDIDLADTPIDFDPNYTFANGDIVIFANTYKAKIGDSTGEINVHDNGVAPNTLVISGDTTNIVIKGGSITIKPYDIEANNYFYEYPSAVPVTLIAQDGALVRFENKVTSGANNEPTPRRGDDTLHITTGARVVIGGDGLLELPKVDLGVTGENILPGTIEFNKNAGDSNLTYTGNISGAGHVVRSGTGGGVFTLTGDQTYTGDTRVSGNTLTIAGGLGTVYDSGSPATIVGRNYTGKIQLTKENGATESVLEFSGVDLGFTQILSGSISGESGTVLSISNGRKVEISSDLDNTPHYNPNEGKTAAAYGHNTFQGDLYIGDSGSILTVSGRLNTKIETFDGGTPMGTSYQHAQYYGNITIADGGTLTFTYDRDYQLHTGKLSGGGDLVINTKQNFYYTGDASGFTGTTTITGGSIFHLSGPAGQSYGTQGARAKAFTVKSGSMLYVGGGGKMHVENFVMENNTTLVVNPGQFTIDAFTTLKLGEIPGNNIAFAFRLAPDDVDTADSPIPKLTITGNSGSVVLYAGSTLRVDSFGYIPQPSQDNGASYPGHFTLMSGLNTATMAASASVGMDGLALAIFGQNEFEILNGRFSLLFTDDGRLILDQTDYIGVPEPATYGLFSGVFIAAFALLRRRRRSAARGAGHEG
ncbi:MAG: PEP-CTERM sorting domain-containing protein, partial [Puniceicoccales bacterium]|nr:PEP-CTERM sorting domain-containing protein [Puniceicoccales bacterium]